MSSPYTHQIEQLVGKHGSLAEKQLIQRWKVEIDRFLSPATRQLLNKSLELELGIEDTLSLKIILKSRHIGPVTTLLAILEDCPNLKSWGGYLLSQQLRFHCGIKLTPERFSRELYFYPSNHAELSTDIKKQLGNNPFSQALNDIRPLGIGINDQQGLSMYFTATDTNWVSALQQELGVTDWQASHLWAWQQLRFDGKQLIAGKTGLELAPLNAQILARFISHYPFPYFRYLIPLRAQRNGNFGRDPVTGRFALYATVN